MPRVIVTDGAAIGLERCRQVLAKKNPRAARRAARRAADAIKQALTRLGEYPDIGRSYPHVQGLRELLIAFGDSGYVAPYRHEPAKDAVFVLAFRHQKEAGYG